MEPVEEDFDQHTGQAPKPSSKGVFDGLQRSELFHELINIQITKVCTPSQTPDNSNIDTGRAEHSVVMMESLDSLVVALGRIGGVTHFWRVNMIYKLGKLCVSVCSEIGDYIAESRGWQMER